MPSQDVLLNLTQMILLRLHPILMVRIRELRYDVNQRGIILLLIILDNDAILFQPCCMDISSIRSLYQASFNGLLRY